MFCGKGGKESTDGVRFCVHGGADLTRQTPSGCVKVTRSTQPASDISN